ncbi:class I adenylate-forming enzyme family protein [Microbacterium azadirachtae]|nr:class I adenylate-forming enzyme family protein [Microbacterium azadirachtae]
MPIQLDMFGSTWTPGAAPALLTDLRTGLALTRTELGLATARFYRAIGEPAPSTRIAIEAKHDLVDVIAILSCLRYGLTSIPVDPLLGPRAVAHIMDQTAPVVAILADTRTKVAQACVDMKFDPGSTDADENLMFSGSSLAMLLYTSGTTGKPKGVMFSRQQISFIVETLAGVLEYCPLTKVHSRLPLTFDYGIFQIFLAAIFDQELQLAHRLTPMESQATLVREPDESVVLPIVPRMGSALIAAAKRRREFATSVALVTSTGERLASSIADELQIVYPRARIQPMYGLTECMRVSVGPPFRGTRPDSRAVGRALPGTQVRVCDDGGRELPRGEVGEIRIRGPHVSSGYWSEEGPPDGACLGHGGGRELRSGDLGFQMLDGELCVIGRRQDGVIKHRGHRVSLHEVDAVAGELSNFGDAASIANSDRIHVFYTGPISPDKAEEHLLSALGPLYAPIIAHHLPELPVNARGKLDRAMLEHLADDSKACDNNA